jgi:two-component system sensor kinase FixL
MSHTARVDAVSVADERAAVIVRRLRIGLVAIGIAVLLSIVADHVFYGGRPLFADALDVNALVLVGVALWLSTRDSVRRRPIPLTLAVVALTCASRTLFAVWYGEIGSAAIACILVALIAGATLPWGPWAQLATATIAGGAVVIDVLALHGHVDEPLPHFAVSIVIALGMSVVLAIELERYYRRLTHHDLERRRAEEDLARLNADLELRVMERTAQLAAAKQRVEHEAAERQEALAELRDSQKRLQDIVDNATAVIHVKDPSGRYLLMNRHFETIFGGPRSELIGKTPYDVFPPAVAEALLRNDRAVIAANEPLQVEETLVAHGEPRIFLSVKFPLTDSEGATVGVCGIATDITERKQMEAELRRSEAALSAVVENTTDAIWSIDTDGRVTVMNSGARALFAARFGVPFDSAWAPERIPTTLREEFHQLYRRALAGEHIAVERAYDEPDGTHYYLTSLHPIVSNGAVTGATVFSRDITERTRAEARARQHQAELAHVLRLGTMGEMAAGLAHEINQPLGAIANYAKGAVRRLEAGTLGVDGVLPVLDEIAREALRAGAIIRRLRGLVRKETPAAHRVDLNALVRESVRFIDAEAQKHAVSVDVCLAQDLPPIKGDGIQLEQVLLNLLLNGLEAVQGAANGDRTVSIATAARNGSVEVIVRDSGIGIPPPPADVFAPFFSTKPTGLGMGLSISRSIVEAHGGTLSAARNDDRGSTFRFTLPVE